MSDGEYKDIGRAVVTNGGELIALIDEKTACKTLAALIVGHYGNAFAGVHVVIPTQHELLTKWESGPIRDFVETLSQGGINAFPASFAGSQKTPNALRLVVESESDNLGTIDGNGCFQPLLSLGRGRVVSSEHRFGKH